MKNLTALIACLLFFLRVEAKSAIPDPLAPCTKYSMDMIMSSVEREWIDYKGRKITASWSHVSENGKTIWLLNTRHQYTKVDVCYLSKNGCKSKMV